MQVFNRFKFNLQKKGGDYHFFSLPQSNRYQIIQNLSILPKSTHSTPQFEDRTSLRVDTERRFLHQTKIQSLEQPNVSKNIVTDKWGNKVLCYRLNDVSAKYIVQGKYSPLAYSKKVKDSWVPADYSVDLISQYSYLLNPDRFVNGNDKDVKRIAQSIIKKGDRSLENIIKNSYGFVMNYLTYGRPSAGLYSYAQALKEKITDCGGFSTLLLSLLQSSSIPSRLVVGFLLRPSTIKSSLARLHSYIPLPPSMDLFSLTFNSFYMHVWVEVLLPDDTWLPLDPSIEWQRNKGLIKSEGGYGYVPADRLVTSYGQDFTIIIDRKKYNIDLLQKPVSV